MPLSYNNHMEYIVGAMALGPVGLEDADPGRSRTITAMFLRAYRKQYSLRYKRTVDWAVPLDFDAADATLVNLPDLLADDLPTEAKATNITWQEVAILRGAVIANMDPRDPANGEPPPPIMLIADGADDGSRVYPTFTADDNGADGAPSILITAPNNNNNKRKAEPCHEPTKKPKPTKNQQLDDDDHHDFIPWTSCLGDDGTPLSDDDDHKWNTRRRNERIRKEAHDALKAALAALADQVPTTSHQVIIIPDDELEPLEQQEQQSSTEKYDRYIAGTVYRDRLLNYPDDESQAETWLDRATTEQSAALGLAHPQTSAENEKSD